MGIIYNFSFTIESDPVDYTPFLESHDPVISETGVLPDKIVQVDIVDAENGIVSSTIDAYVDDGSGEIQIYFGETNTFVAPYDGSSSITYIPNGSIDGYDAYRLIIDRTTDYDSLTSYTFRVTAKDSYGNLMNENWSFTTAFWFDFSVTDWIPPWVENVFPDSYGVGGDTNISFEIYDDISGVDVSSVDAYLNGSLIYSGGFLAPFNGSGSSVTPKTKDGYNGYLFNLVNNGTLIPAVTDHVVEVYASDNTGHSDGYNWYFKTGVDIRNVEVGEFENNVIVTFGEDMPVLVSDTPLDNPANYLFSNGMYARDVEVIDKRTAKLWVELFYQNPTFTLQVQNIIDSYGYNIPSSYNNYQFSPYQSDANITNYNAKIRTWHESKLVWADSERIYVGGTKGIDVFRKLSSTNISRWAQIFDAYEIQAMFIMNYPDDLVISDTATPELANQSPAPNAKLPSVPQIEFTITDLDTAIEPTATTIYINGILAFRGGYGGWTNGYSGRLEVDYKELDFIIVPPTPFLLGQVIAVRVVATDLLGNRLDSTYQFSLGVSAISGGWGGSAFGTFSFGGI